ncbi:Putative malate transporter [Rickettsiales bacterium Ac37b]|nr:Putative malate transporter [Rickettsiales bacterium Ac37b]
MVKREINLKLLLPLILLGVALWYLPTPRGLDSKGWHILIIFMITVIGIIISPMPMGATAFAAIATLVLTNTLSLHNALSGFSSHIVWLVVIAFFIARGFIKSGLGERIAYYLISKFGHSTIGLSYSLIFTEFLLAPMIPSATARGGGIIFPIVQSLAEEYAKSPYFAHKTGKNYTAAFLITVCFHTNVITCALFLTAMAANPLIASLAASLNVHISWLNWSLATIVPGVVNLIILPYLVYFLLPPDIKHSVEIPKQASHALAAMGKLSRNEIIMIITFAVMILLWVVGPAWKIDATTTALIGFLALITTGVLSWDDAITEKGAWKTLMWFATLLMMAEFLTKLGITAWAEVNIKNMLGNAQGPYIILILGIIFFYIHYFFASITAHATVMYTTFMLMLIHLGVAPLIAGISLAVLSNLSGGLTHYGISSAPIYFGAGYLSAKEWWKVGGIISTCNMIIWIAVGSIWLYILGWW